MPGRAGCRGNPSGSLHRLSHGAFSTRRHFRTVGRQPWTNILMCSVSTTYCGKLPDQRAAPQKPILVARLIFGLHGNELPSPKCWKMCSVGIPVQSTAQLRGPCPLHKGSANSKSFVVNKDRGLWYCHSSCKTGGNAIDLFAAAMGMKDDLYAAAVLLCERLGVVPVYLPPSDKRKG